MVFKRLHTKISDVPIYILPWFDLQNIALAGNMYKAQTKSTEGALRLYNHHLVEPNLVF